MKFGKIPLTSIIALTLISSCGNGTESAGNVGDQEPSGRFSGTLGDKRYEVAVNCRFFDTDSFMMRSDATDTIDSNGDGIIISGDEGRGKFVLTIVDNGVTYSTGRLENFVKGNNRAEGSGQLFEGGGRGTKSVEFTVTCN